MSMKEQNKRALISVDSLDKVEIVVKNLMGMGWHITATDETVEHMEKRGITVEKISDFVSFNQDFGFPPTFHPKMESALTQDVPYKIDLVYDVPYQLSKGVDVGGMALLSLAAKGKRIVCFTLEDILNVIEHLRRNAEHQTIPQSYRNDLINKTFAFVSKCYLDLAKKDTEYDGFIGRRYYALMNGENPYQVPSDMFTFDNYEKASLPSFKNLGTNAPCFVNMADLDSILHTLSIISEAFKRNFGKVPYIAIAAKHGNACGAAINWEEPENSLLNALFGNPLAIWGGEFISNFKITEHLAGLLYKSNERKERLGSKYWMLDVVVAPEFDEKAINVLSKKKSRKLLSCRDIYEPNVLMHNWHYRYVRGGFLRHPAPDYVIDFSKITDWDKDLDDQLLFNIIIAWAVSFSSNHGGNEVAITGDNMLLSAGGGPSTVEAALTAVKRATANGHDLKCSIFGADAFFPFIDAPQVLYNAGCSAGVVPGGGKNEPLVREFFKKNNMKTAFLDPKYRGFIRH